MPKWAKDTCQNHEVVGVAVGMLETGQSLNFAVPATLLMKLIKGDASGKTDVVTLLEQVDSLAVRFQTSQAGKRARRGLVGSGGSRSHLLIYGSGTSKCATGQPGGNTQLTGRGCQQEKRRIRGRANRGSGGTATVPLASQNSKCEMENAT